MLAAVIEGMGQYNPTERISLVVNDAFSHDQDVFNITNATSENQRIYSDNVFHAKVDWEITTKFSASAAYDNYALMYDNDVNNYLDRVDHGLDVYGYYDYSPKTNFFLEYRIIQSKYDEVDIYGLSQDNMNNYLYGGLNWQTSVSTSLTGKAGYQDKTYDSDAFKNQSDTGSFTYQLQWNWLITNKSSLLVKSAYNIEETDSVYFLSKTVFSNRLGYTHRFTNRLRGNFLFIYENSDYDQLEDLSRTDDRYYFNIGLEYAFLKWLALDASYSYDQKDSNIDRLDYDTNFFRIGITGKL